MGFTYSQRWNPRTRSWQWKKTSSDGPTVLMDFGWWEITLREVLFSLFIIGLMTALGFWISSYVEKKAEDSVLKWRQAAQITDPDEFKHAMKTDVGHAFVEGDFKTLDPVTHPKLGGKHFSIFADWQEYTMHTRTVTVEDEDGKTHTEVETYWTWDTYKTERMHAKLVEFCGSKFSASAFSYDMVGNGYRTVDNGYNRRIEFAFKPTAFHATIATELHSGSVHGRPSLWQGRSISYVYEWATTTHACLVFWIIWVIVSIGVAVAFVRLDNWWLED